MPNKELNCKWYFGPEPAGSAQGPNSSTALTFKGSMYHSLIRESIQNSLDAVYDKAQPVRVRFEYRSFDASELPEFFTIKDHIQGCLNHFPVLGKKLFENMLSFFRGGYTQEMGYFRITDSNTRGMSYDKNDAESPFNAFISEGVAAHSDEGAGGAFGFGKIVFWNLSPISSVFVSTKTRAEEKYGEQTLFVGKSKLCTHYITEGELLTSNGIYSTDGSGEVITDESLIPEYFRPKDYGTSVYVLGAPHLSEEIKTELVKSVLKNFWMTIHQGKLIVEIDDIEINQSTIQGLMGINFESENNGEKELFDYNPRVFYETVVRAEASEEGYKIVEENVELDGINNTVRLYLRKNPDSNGYFLTMRSPLMSVQVLRYSNCKGMEGVFVCDSEEGNRFIREMESSSHDSWTRQNFEARGNKPGVRATRALNAIKDFIVNAVREELQQDAPDTEQIAGLDSILTISTPKDANNDRQKDEIVDPENLLNPDKKKKPTDVIKPPKPTVRKLRATKGVFDENGRLRSNAGGKRSGKHRGGVQGPGTSTRSRETPDGYEGNYASPIDVSYRTWSQTDDVTGCVWHYIRIFSDEEITDAIIELYATNEDGTILGLDIKEASEGKIQTGETFKDATDYDDQEDDSAARDRQVRNALGGIRVQARIPKTLKVRFNSNIKYSLRINSSKI